MNPGQVAVAAGKAAELYLLGIPEKAQGKKTHEIDQKARAELEQSVPQLPLVSYVVHRHSDFEDQQCHRDAENGVAQIRHAPHVVAGDVVVRSRHPEKVYRAGGLWREEAFGQSGARPSREKRVFGSAFAEALLPDSVQIGPAGCSTSRVRWKAFRRLSSPPGFPAPGAMIFRRLCSVRFGKPFLCP